VAGCSVLFSISICREHLPFVFHGLLFLGILFFLFFLVRRVVPPSALKPLYSFSLFHSLAFASPPFTSLIDLPTIATFSPPPSAFYNRQQFPWVCSPPPLPMADPRFFPSLTTERPFQTFAALRLFARQIHFGPSFPPHPHRYP